MLTCQGRPRVGTAHDDGVAVTKSTMWTVTIKWLNYTHSGERKLDTIVYCEYKTKIWKFFIWFILLL